MNNSMSTKKLWWIALSVIAICLIVFLSFIISSASDNQVPSSFNEARLDASESSQHIVGTIEETKGAIDTIQQLEKEGKGVEALELVIKQLEKNRQTREDATKLALGLEEMAKQVPNILPREAAETALVAISRGTALISMLISYHNDLNELLMLVRDKIERGIGDYYEINMFIEQLNEQKEQINTLNKEFNDQMKLFDSFYQVKER